MDINCSEFDLLNGVFFLECLSEACGKSLETIFFNGLFNYKVSFAHTEPVITEIKVMFKSFETFVLFLCDSNLYKQGEVRFLRHKFDNFNQISIELYLQVSKYNLLHFPICQGDNLLSLKR